ncbi:MAG: nuclear transport factor 2 family protein [Myxococcota bacterium]
MSLDANNTTEILQLYSRYNTAIDTGDAEGFANCFVPDGIFNNGVAVIEGHDGISKFAEQTHSAMPGMRHNAMNIVVDGVEGSGDQASGSAFLIGYLVNDGFKVIVTGRYQDQLKKTGDGWRFTERIFTMDK